MRRTAALHPEIGLALGLLPRFFQNLQPGLVHGDNIVRKQPVAQEVHERLNLLTAKCASVPGEARLLRIGWFGICAVLISPAELEDEKRVIRNNL